MNDSASYLGQLKFDQKLKKTTVAKYIGNLRIVLLIILLITIAGVSAYRSIPRRLNPEVKLPIVLVSTILPGSNARVVEEEITNPLEDKLKGMEKLDSITSTSRDNVSSITLQFLSSVPVDKARDDVQSIVDAVKLPTDAQTPTVAKLDFERSPVWQFALSTDASHEASLYTVAKKLQKKLEDIPQIDEVTVQGIPTFTYEIRIDEEKVRQLGITSGQIKQAITLGTTTFPAGTLQTVEGVYNVSIEQGITTLSDIRNIRLNVAGTTVRLADIATVQEMPKPDRQQSFIASREGALEQAVTMSVYKTASSNIDTAVQLSEDLVKKDLIQYPYIHKNTITNIGTQITDDFTKLVKEFGVTVLLVFALLTVFLGIRQATIASVTVPLTFLASFTIINAFGLSLNFLTSFSFLIALGLLIDDTIVVVGAMTAYYKTGKFTPYETGLLVWKDFIVPIWTTTITTLWAFLPLLIASGIIGQFIKSIPIVIAATMISSTAIAVLITLPLMVFFLKPVLPPRFGRFLRVLGSIVIIILPWVLAPRGKLMIGIVFVIYALCVVLWMVRAKIFSYVVAHTRIIRTNRTLVALKERLGTGIIDINRLSAVYYDAINKVLASRKNMHTVLTIIILFFFLSVLLIPLGLVKNEFFPKTDEDTVYLNIEYPQGTSTAETTAQAYALLSDIRTFEQVKTATLDVGAARTGSRFTTSPGSLNTALITLDLEDAKKRNKTSIQIAEDLRKAYATYPKGTVTVTEISGGPPAGADISVTVLGDDFETVKRFASKIEDFAKTQPGIVNASLSAKDAQATVVFVPSAAKLAEDGLTVADIATAIREYSSGLTLDTIKVAGDDTDITFVQHGGTGSLDSLNTILVKGKKGSLPIANYGAFEPRSNPSSISHQDGKRAVTLTAGVKKGFNTIEENKILLDFAKTLPFPEGYRVDTGGVNDENAKSVQSIIQAMILSAVLIVSTMVIQFRSFRQAGIILMLIPLASAGVFFMFGLTGTPLSFPALIGILALFGIVVTTGIVVMEKINQNRREGMHLKHAITDAAQSRLEPVLLTSLATIFGLLPITISDPLWRGLGGAIISGLLFSGIIKLFFVPIVYYMWFGGEEKS